jgi:hypothetical protein
MNIRKGVCLLEISSTVFKGAFKKQITEPDTLGLSAIIGIAQGLKYKGSIKTGVLTAIVVTGAIGAWNGLANVVENWDGIVRMADEKCSEEVTFEGISND